MTNESCGRPARAARVCGKCAKRQWGPRPDWKAALAQQLGGLENGHIHAHARTHTCTHFYVHTETKGQTRHVQASNLRVLF